ncbi:MAG: glycosyltransferase [Anaerolineaceae bacterium]|nr:glycosyltransferase [Anaerolineaceae bacterium]
MLSYHTCPLETLGGKDTGGMNVYVRELAHHLGKMGVHVDVFTRSQDEHVPQVLHQLCYGNRVVHMPAGPEVYLPKKQLTCYIPEFAEQILQFGQEKGLQYDLIHSHYWMSGVAAKQLKDSWQIPIVQMFHTLGKMKNRIAQSPAEMEGDYRLNGEQEVIDAADKIVIATPAEQSQLEYLYQAPEEKMEIIPPGVDTSKFYPIPADEAKEVIGISPKDRMLLFVGRIEPLKGVDVLMQAISKLHRNNEIDGCPHYLVIVGGNPEAEGCNMDVEMNRLMTLRSELDLKDLVVFLGKRDQDMLPYYYSAAEIVIMPSHYESFGMVALEAMACGTPVVASQVGGLAYLVQDGITGYVVPHNDPDSLSEKIRELVCNEDIRQQMGKQANAYAQDYDWHKITERTIALYEKTLQTAPV